MPPITLEKTLELDGRLRVLRARCRELTAAVTPAGDLPTDQDDISLVFEDVALLHIDVCNAQWACRPATALVGLDYLLCLRNLLGAAGMSVSARRSPI